MTTCTYNNNIYKKNDDILSIDRFRINGSIESKTQVTFWFNFYCVIIILQTYLSFHFHFQEFIKSRPIETS